MPDTAAKLRDSQIRGPRSLMKVTSNRRVTGPALPRLTMAGQPTIGLPGGRNGPAAGTLARGVGMISRRSPTGTTAAADEGAGRRAPIPATGTGQTGRGRMGASLVATRLVVRYAPAGAPSPHRPAIRTGRTPNAGPTADARRTGPGDRTAWADRTRNVGQMARDRRACGGSVLGRRQAISAAPGPVTPDWLARALDTPTGPTDIRSGKPDRSRPGRCLAVVATRPARCPSSGQPASWRQARSHPA